MIVDVLHREWVFLWYYFSLQLSQIFRYWVLGMVLGSAISVFAKEHIHGLFRSLHGKRLGVLGILIASALGIASPLCMYGTIPLAASFSESGMEDDWLAAFMMSSILLNPQLILYSMALVRAALVIRILFSFLCGTAAGLLIRWFYREKGFFNFTGFSAPHQPGHGPQSSDALSEKSGEECQGHRPHVPAGCGPVRPVSAVRPRRRRTSPTSRPSPPTPPKRWTGPGPMGQSAATRTAALTPGQQLPAPGAHQGRSPGSGRHHRGVQHRLRRSALQHRHALPGGQGPRLHRHCRRGHSG